MIMKLYRVKCIGCGNTEVCITPAEKLDDRCPLCGGVEYKSKGVLENKKRSVMIA